MYNTASLAGGVLFGRAGTTSLSFSNGWQNGSAAIAGAAAPSCVQCTAAWPSFQSVGGPASTWDLRLQPHSVLIDRGDPNVLDQHDGSRSDMGAFGGPASLGW